MGAAVLSEMSLSYLFASFRSGCILLHLAADMIHYRYITTLHQVIGVAAELHVHRNKTTLMVVRKRV